MDEPKVWDVSISLSYARIGVYERSHIAFYIEESEATRIDPVWFNVLRKNDCAYLLGYCRWIFCSVKHKGIKTIAVHLVQGCGIEPCNPRGRSLKEKSVAVIYSGKVIGDYIADIIVANSVILELKSVKDLHPAHETQLVNYLKATGIEIGLLINFGHSVKVKRKILDHRVHKWASQTCRSNVFV